VSSLRNMQSAIARDQEERFAGGVPNASSVSSLDKSNGARTARVTAKECRDGTRFADHPPPFLLVPTNRSHDSRDRPTVRRSVEVPNTGRSPKKQDRWTICSWQSGHPGSVDPSVDRGAARGAVRSLENRCRKRRLRRYQIKRSEQERRRLRRGYIMH